MCAECDEMGHSKLVCPYLLDEYVALLDNEETTEPDSDHELVCDKDRVTNEMTEESIEVDRNGVRNINEGIVDPNSDHRRENISGKESKEDNENDNKSIENNDIDDILDNYHEEVETKPFKSDLKDILSDYKEEISDIPVKVEPLEPIRVKKEPITIKQEPLDAIGDDIMLFTESMQELVVEYEKLQSQHCQEMKNIKKEPLEEMLVEPKLSDLTAKNLNEVTKSVDNFCDVEISQHCDGDSEYEGAGESAPISATANFEKNTEVFKNILMKDVENRLCYMLSH